MGWSRLRMMLRRQLMLTALLLTLLAALAPAQADDKPLKGVALVVGQSAYAHLAPLANPVNDARAIDRLLSDLGFEVVTVVNGDHKKLARSLQRFAEDAAEADVALLYYSGHGIEAGGEDFLVPVDAATALDDAATGLVPLNDILDQLLGKVPVTIVLMDACRTSPFPPGSTIRIWAAQPSRSRPADLPHRRVPQRLPNRRGRERQPCDSDRLCGRTGQGSARRCA